MALKKFTIGEMFSVTQPWVEAGNPERLLLESLPGMASLMRFVELAHGGLIASQSRAEAARLAALTGEFGHPAGPARDPGPLRRGHPDCLSRAAWRH